MLGGVVVDLNLKETELCLGLPGGGGGGGGDTAAPATAGNKRGFSETVDLKLNLSNEPRGDGRKQGCADVSTEQPPSNSSLVAAVSNDQTSCPKDPSKPPAKAQVVGWPPVRSYRKNMIIGTSQRSSSGGSSAGEAAFVKVSMDGAPYLRKVDLKTYKSYQELSNALAKMFSSFTMGTYGAEGMIDFMNERKLMDLLNTSDYVPTYQDKDADWMLVGDVPWEMFVESCKRIRIMKGSEAIGLAPRAMEKCKNRA